jgi:hypothetical protein
VHWWLMKKENKKRDAVTREDVSAAHTPEQLSNMEEYSPLYRYTL